jgi:hypothetical protein
MTTINSSAPRQYLTDEASFRETLAQLSSASSLSVNSQGNLVPSSFLNDLFSGSMINNRRLVELKIMEFLVQGKRWLKPDDIQLIDQLASKVGLFMKKPDNGSRHKELRSLINLVVKEILQYKPVSAKDYAKIHQDFQTRYRRILSPYSEQCEQVRKNFEEALKAQQEGSGRIFEKFVGAPLPKPAENVAKAPASPKGNVLHPTADKIGTATKGVMAAITAFAGGATLYFYPQIKSAVLATLKNQPAPASTGYSTLAYAGGIGLLGAAAGGIYGGIKAYNDGVRNMDDAKKYVQEGLTSVTTRGANFVANAQIAWNERFNSTPTENKDGDGTGGGDGAGDKKDPAKDKSTLNGQKPDDKPIEDPNKIKLEEEKNKIKLEEEKNKIKLEEEKNKKLEQEKNKKLEQEKNKKLEEEKNKKPVEDKGKEDPNKTEEKSPTKPETKHFLRNFADGLTEGLNDWIIVPFRKNVLGQKISQDDEQKIETLKDQYHEIYTKYNDKKNIIVENTDKPMIYNIIGEIARLTKTYWNDYPMPIFSVVIYRLERFLVPNQDAHERWIKHAKYARDSLHYNDNKVSIPLSNLYLFKDAVDVLRRQNVKLDKETENETNTFYETSIKTIEDLIKDQEPVLDFSEKIVQDKKILTLEQFIQSIDKDEAFILHAMSQGKDVLNKELYKQNAQKEYDAQSIARRVGTAIYTFSMNTILRYPDFNEENFNKKCLSYASEQQKWAKFFELCPEFFQRPDFIQTLDQVLPKQDMNASVMNFDNLWNFDYKPLPNTSTGGGEREPLLDQNEVDKLNNEDTSITGTGNRPALTNNNNNTSTTK